MQGSQLQVDCSFDEHGQYVEQGKEWDNLTLDSVSVLETETQNPDNVYTVTADNLSSVRLGFSMFQSAGLCVHRTCMRAC